MEAESRARRTLYVGGLDGAVTDHILRAAFVPFGELKDVSVPLDHAAGTNRGFGFVEFEDEGDAAEAVDNMDGAELFGRTLRVTLARPQQGTGKGKAVWSAEEWYASLTGGDGDAGGDGGGGGGGGGGGAAGGGAAGGGGAPRRGPAGGPADAGGT
jgi:peptidyl-prolyl isomerase E (cyclophilin E)